MMHKALKLEFDMKELTNVSTNTALTFTATARQVLPCVRYSHVLFMSAFRVFFIEYTCWYCKGASLASKKCCYVHIIWQRCTENLQKMGVRNSI